MQKKLINAGSFYLVSNLFNKGIVFLTIPIYTRVLSSYDYGIINTFTAWVGIITILIGFAFHMGVRAAFKDYISKINNFFKSIIILNTIIFISIFLIFTLVYNFCSFNKYYILISLCLFQGFSLGIIQDYSMYLMMKLRYKERSLLMVFPNIIITLLSIFFIIFILNSNKYLGKIVTGTIINFIVAIVIIIKVLKFDGPIINKEYWKYVLRVSTPLIFHGLSLTILSQSDRIMLTYFRGPSETGIYSLSYNFGMIANLLITSIDGVWVPWFYKNMESESIELLNEKVRLYIEIIVIPIICILLVSPDLLKLLAPRDYWDGISLLPLIISASIIIFYYTLYVNIEHYHKKTKVIALNTLISALLNIVLNIVFIPKYGMLAAAGTTTVSYAISFLLHYKYSKTIEPELFPVQKYLIMPFWVLIAIVLFYLFEGNMFVRWILASMYLLSYVLFRRRLLISIVGKRIN